jgi:hypothetical protein
VESRIACEAVYSTALFESWRVSDLLGRFVTLARRLADAPADAPVEALAVESAPVV